MACLAVCRSVGLPAVANQKKGWIRSKKKKNLIRAEQITRSVGHWKKALLPKHQGFCFRSGHGADTDSGRQTLAASRQHRDPRSCPGGQSFSNVVHAHHHDQSAPLRCTPSHHIRVFSLSFHSTEILDPKTQCLTPTWVPTHRLALDHTRYACMRARI